MQKNYELLYIVHPDLEGSTDKITEKVSGFIAKAGGKVVSHEDWGKRKLAYKIAKNDFGVYALVNFELDSVKLSEVERDLRLSEEIIRSMVVAIPEISEARAAKKKPRVGKDAPAEKKEAPASIIVAEEKPAKATKAKKAEATEEVNTEVVEEKAEKKPAAKKVTKKAEEKVDEKAEEDRLKKLDEKLDELLK